MKLTNADIERLLVRNKASLDKLYSNTKIPPALSFKLAMILEELERVVRILGKEKDRCLQAHCDKDELGNPTISRETGAYIFNENPMQAKNIIDELMDAEVTVSCERAEVRVSELPEYGVTLSPRDMTNLSVIIEWIDG